MEPDASSHPAAEPGVSIIIPVYNYGRYLREAIDSALAQTHRHLEVLVIDDGSTDDSAAIAACYGEKVRCISQKNAGLSAARNTGIRAATQPFVAFLDADDVLEPRALAASLHCFSELPPDFGMVSCAYQRTEADGTPIIGKAHAFHRSCELRARDILLKSRFMPSAVLARREVFEACGLFDTSLRSSEDRDMWIRIGEKYRIYFLAERLVRIRKHGGNMSSHAARMRENSRRVIHRAFARGVVSRLDVFYWLRVYAISHFEVAWMQYDEGRRRPALISAGISLLLWPWFPHPERLNEPRFFRARAFVRFLWETIFTARKSAAPK